MELRGQENKEIGMPSSLVYNPPIIRESPSEVVFPSSTGGGEERKRRDETGNGTALLNPSVTLDHQHQTHKHGRYLSPDPVPVAIAITGAITTTTKITPVTVRYRECLKNHAASIGGHVLDGCGEFMPGSEEDALEAMKCAACDCHRNFHRKEVGGESQFGANCYYYYNPNDKNNSSRRNTILPQLPPPLPSPFQQHQNLSPGQIPPMTMAFSGGGGGGATESSSEELNVFQSNAAVKVPQPPPPPFGLSKKRFRTKFSHEQKDKMLEFAEKVGWRFQKQDEAVVQQFCGEVGIKRQVLKIWMHNNKHSMKKQL